MSSKLNAIVLLTVIVIVIILYIHFQEREKFATKDDKAQAILNWFRANASDNAAPSYSKFRRDLNDASNIVEYEDVLALYKDKNLTLSSVKKVV